MRWPPRAVAALTACRSYPQCGDYDTQADAIAHMIPLVALLAGNPIMLPTIDAIIRVTQNTDEAAG